MDARLTELYVQRGRLRERIGAQREQLGRDLAPLRVASDLADRTGSVLRQTQQWLSGHPTAVTALVVALVVWRPRAVLRSLRWAYSMWRGWSGLRNWAVGTGRGRYGTK